MTALIVLAATIGAVVLVLIGVVIGMAIAAVAFGGDAARELRDDQSHAKVEAGSYYTNDP